MSNQLIGLFGGTFDPVHNGHLHVAQQLLKQLPLQQIQFIPCYQPIHRTTPIASAQERLTLLKLATANYPDFSVNSVEFERGEPSYTINTVKALKARYPEHTLCWILGADAFSQFESWNGYKQVLAYCHLIVVNRPGTPESAVLASRQTTHKDDLQAEPYGRILLETISPSPISATRVREQLASGTLDPQTLAPEVLAYIQAQKLYT